ncbi:hypothetical protein [Planococcus sp. CAU13]|uniref:hypothetical protein n=1 Tax=Planococcus sp. CAU13 TaxID=1541197 RepID=UPI00053009E3|nr:hypothetical protein [Planococcus sp. CAU13]
MKIALVCPSNMLFMPYVGNYTKVLDDSGIDYDVINWDRNGTEEPDHPLKFRDNKADLQRGYIDYFKYRNFVLRILKKNNYDKIIVFSIQLAYFLKRYLLKYKKGDYILDIRDYNRILKAFDIRKVVEGSAYTVISSPGFRKWLPDSGNYLVSHNTTIDSIDELKECQTAFLQKDKVKIAFIGALSDYKVNIDFIDSLKDCGKVDLVFHGEGLANKDIEEYIVRNGVSNVELTGRYTKEQENALYHDSDLIHALRYSENINCRTLLPNRLYNAALHGKPVIVAEDSYLADLTRQYGLGLVVDSFSDFERKISRYFAEFNFEDYKAKRKDFFQKVVEDNLVFRDSVNKFLGF